jgi:hypothetical protein
MIRLIAPLIALVALFASSVVLGQPPAAAPKAAAPTAVPNEAPPKKLGGLRIGNDKDGHTELDREKAADFALAQLAKLIDYLFLAAVAILGLIVKSCIFDRLSANPQPAALPGGERWLLGLAIVFLAVSAFAGMLAYGYLPRLITAVEFSLDGPIGIFTAGQWLACGLGLMFVGIFCIARLVRGV